MRALASSVVSIVVPVTVWIAVSSAQSSTCPPEVASAKAILTARGGDVQASLPGRNQNSLAAARSQDVQAPRTQDVQSPRSQDVQAPRTQDVQSPRSQDVQAPRTQDVQSPRSQDVQAPRNQNAASDAKRAQTLVKEAEAACKTGDTARASEKALAALELLRK
jgi:hypothetical protein